MADEAQALRDAHEELRHLPLGGRGHLADACLDGAAEIERLAAQLEGAVSVDEAAALIYEHKHGEPPGDRKLGPGWDSWELAHRILGGR
jgi:hypothetical protein